MKLVKVLVLLAVIGGVVALASKFTGDGSDGPVAKQPDEKKKGDGGGVALEERYGFTSQTIDP